MACDSHTYSVCLMGPLTVPELSCCSAPNVGEAGGGDLPAVLPGMVLEAVPTWAGGSGGGKRCSVPWSVHSVVFWAGLWDEGLYSWLAPVSHKLLPCPVPALPSHGTRLAICILPVPVTLLHRHQGMAPCLHTVPCFIHKTCHSPIHDSHCHTACG